MTPPRVVPFAPHARARQSTRARRGFHPATDSRLTDSPSVARHRCARRGTTMEFSLHRSRASPRRLARRALRPRAREGTRLGSTTRLGTDATGTRGITLVAYHRPDRGPTAQCRHRATRPRRDARRANERTRRERRRKPSIRPNPRRAAREETTVERAREEEKGEIFEGWMSC